MGSNKKCNRFVLCLAATFFFAFPQYACSSEKKPSENCTKSSLSDKKEQNIGEASERQVVVYYFHGKFRCHTCKRIEKLTKEAVKESFDSEINAGLLELKVINVEEKENSHFTKDYQLFTRSVVVSSIVKGKEERWKNLQKVWELVHDEKAFKEYIRREVLTYLSHG